MARARLLDVAALGVFAALLAAGAGALTSRPARPADTIEIGIRYSRFEPATLIVPVGRPVTFVLRNDDPIQHEWLIGDDALHERHRTGTEPHHDTVPTEVSIPPLTTVVTTVTFAEPVSWRYICHLPGHEGYGMVGLLTSR